jgi:hypothetical protein
MLPPRALPAAILIATKYLVFRGQGTSIGRDRLAGCLLRNLNQPDRLRFTRTCSRAKKIAWFHEVRAAVSRAIMSSSFVGMTRHKRPDSVLIRPLLSLPFSSFSFESITGFRIARCVSTCARIDALFSPMPPGRPSVTPRCGFSVPNRRVLAQHRRYPGAQPCLRLGPLLMPD